MENQFDIIIIGAGLSGVGMATHLKKQCPNKTVAILEARAAIGGTWDLFNYPGIRSDSDMHTLGYQFKPWLGGSLLASGPDIKSYIRTTAEENQIYDQIHFEHKVINMNWLSNDSQWQLDVETNNGEQKFRAQFILSCAGYYRYSAGFTPNFPNLDKFNGDFIHPQHWPENFDYTNKKVVIIGSGATAVTLVPEMAKKAAKVTMLQRSPTYFISRPNADKFANLLKKILPEMAAYHTARWLNIIFQQGLYQLTRFFPNLVKTLLLSSTKWKLGKKIDVAKHFTPSYNPWDQRICVIPDNDLFECIKNGDADVVTDHIDTFTENGIALKSGEKIEADIIVSATGLELVMLGEINLQVDGETIDIPSKWSYKGMMFSDVPNLINTFGYINSSWTLRSDMVAHWTCRLIQHLDQNNQHVATPKLREEDKSMPAQPWIADFNSGYMQRAMQRFPRQGDREPWLNKQSYFRDKKVLYKAPIADGVLNLK